MSRTVRPAIEIRRRFQDPRTAPEAASCETLGVDRDSAVNELFTQSELKQYRRDGFVIGRNLICGSLRQRILDVTYDSLARQTGPIEYEADLKYPGAPESKCDGGGETIRRIKHAFNRDPVFAEYVVRPEITGRLHQLLGPGVVMPLAHHNCVMTKMPDFSSDTGWHQDFRYWAFARPDLVSVWLALGPERPENGCLDLIPGSHRMQLAHERFDADSFLREDRSDNRSLIESATAAELEAGDVLFFHCLMLHAASRNCTTEARYSAVFTFRAVDNPPQPGTRSASLPEVLLSPPE